MPNIKPASDLRNYDGVRGMLLWVNRCSDQDGHDRYAVLDMEEYRWYEALLSEEKLPVGWIRMRYFRN